jgi:4,5-dihydroxyphthalate decarboxylase
MTNARIRLACGYYDATAAIARGLVSMPGFDLRILEATSVPAMFTGMFKGEYDVSEMSLAELIYYRSRGKDDFIAIPVFPVRCFRHGFILCDTTIEGPQNLNGKNIGFMRWVQTAAIWMRGLLIEEYGISPTETGWYVASIHHWDEGEGEEIKPRDGSVIRSIERRDRDAFQSAYSALLKGEIHALGSTKHSTPLIQREKGIRRLFKNYQNTEATYFRKTRILPIMHVIVVRTALISQYPDLPEKLFRLFSESKRLGQEWVKSAPSSVLAWKESYLDNEQEVFQGDPWAYGLELNWHVLNRFLSYCHNQGISDQKLDPQELFAPTTWRLTEIGPV